MKIVIIGAGPAGVSAVETIRAHDEESVITMISAEPYQPYSPPAMADHFLHGSGAHFWRSENWAEEQEVQYLSGMVVQGIQADDHKVIFSSGEEMGYERLVIATGSRLYAPVEGADLPGVYNFKSLSAAQKLVDRVESSEAHKAIIVGAGFIGMEIGLLLRSLGLEVTQVEMTDQVMPAMLDAETAGVAQGTMEARGIEVLLNTKAVGFTGDTSAEGVQLESGETLEADVLVAATGVRPNLECLEGSGIDHGWGITVDRNLRTNKVDIFAAGDAVEAPDLLTGEVYVHAIFPNAVEQGNVVGLNLVGYDVAYEGAHRMNSLKHLELPIMAAGLKTGDEILRNKRNGNLKTIYIENDRIVGFQIVGDVQSAGVLRALMNRGENIKTIKDQLLEPSFGVGIVNWKAMAPWYI